MQIRISVKNLILYILILSSYIVSAWWETGHMVVAQIAKNELIKKNPKLYQLIENLAFLGGNLSTYFYYDFQYTAIWADDIKEQGFQMYDEWHYIDLPINELGLLINFDHLTTNNAQWAINKIAFSLNSTRYLNSLNIEKGVMLRLLIHIIGDIHQPLHATSLYNEKYQSDKGDAGGNKYLIQYNLTEKSIKNLHAFWDSGAGVLPDTHTRPLTQDNFDWIRSYSEQLQLKFPRDKLSQQLSKTTPASWIQESYQLAKEKVYGPLNGSPVITQEYRDQSYEVVEQRLIIGGYRLADYLEKIFSRYNLDQNSQENINTKNTNLRGTPKDQ